MAALISNRQKKEPIYMTTECHLANLSNDEMRKGTDLGRNLLTIYVYL